MFMLHSRLCTAHADRFFFRTYCAAVGALLVATGAMASAQTTPSMPKPATSAQAARGQTAPLPASGALTAVPAPSGVQAARCAEFLEQVMAHFAEWDRDDDKTLTLTELDSAASDAKTTGRAAAAVVALRRAARSKLYTLPLLTQENIVTLANAAPAPRQPNLALMYGTALSKITQAKHTLFASGLPRLESVRQGRLGDCFCLAPLGAMLARDPQQVVGIFQLQPDNTYHVLFGTQAVSVAPPTDAELALTSTTDADGVWVNLYEKAVGQARVLAAPPGRNESFLDAVSRGGSAGTMLQTLTGHKITRFSCRFARDKKLTMEEQDAKLNDMRAQLTAAQTEKRLMTCGTGATTMPGITPNHAYAVLGYDASADTVRLWNPHGDAFTPKGTSGPLTGYPRAKGIFSMPLKDFAAQFAGLAFETTEPTAK